MKFYIVDVFAEKKYQGNQLAVLVPDYELSDCEMQQIAREINFSETTFILSGKQANGGYNVRIFTPDIEVPFAGHPTLGTAYVIHKIIEGNEEDYGKVLLNYEVGTISVTIDETGLTMEQNQPSFEELIQQDINVMADMLCIDTSDIDCNYPIQVVSTGLPCVIFPLKTVDAVKRCSINRSLMQDFFASVYESNLLVFAQDGDNDLYVRVIMPDSGITEDPATGSANGNLAGYLLKYNYFKRSKLQYNVRQGNEINRPSLLHVNATLIEGSYEILVGGNVHLVSKGEWL